MHDAVSEAPRLALFCFQPQIRVTLIGDAVMDAEIVCDKLSGIEDVVVMQIWRQKVLVVVKGDYIHCINAVFSLPCTLFLPF